jgi:hypothetical protein
MSSGSKVLRGRWQARAPRVSYCSKRRTERSHVRGALGGAHGEAQLPHRTVVAQQPREDEQGAWLEGALPARVRLVGSCRVLIRPTSSVILSEVSASCCAPAGSRQRELFVDGETAVCAHVLQLALLDGETPCRRTGPSRGRDGRVEHHLMREAMARVVKGAEKEVEIMSTRSGVLAQTGSTLVKRGLYCAVLGRVHRVRVQCARALRVHARLTHLGQRQPMSRAEIRAKVSSYLSSLPRVVGGYRVSNTGGSRDTHTTHMVP